jgi:hypothetical protein
MAHVTVFNETTGVPLTALCNNWNFMGTIVNIGGKFLSSPRTVRLLTLTSGPLSWATMVSEPRSPLLGVGLAVIFFILAADADADAWACHIFFE